MEREIPITEGEFNEDIWIEDFWNTKGESFLRVLDCAMEKYSGIRLSDL